MKDEEMTASELEGSSPIGCADVVKKRKIFRFKTRDKRRYAYLFFCDTCHRLSIGYKRQTMCADCYDDANAQQIARGVMGNEPRGLSASERASREAVNPNTSQEAG